MCEWVCVCRGSRRRWWGSCGRRSAVGAGQRGHGAGRKGRGRGGGRSGRAVKGCLSRGDERRRWRRRSRRDEELGVLRLLTAVGRNVGNVFSCIKILKKYLCFFVMIIGVSDSNVISHILYVSLYTPVVFSLSWARAVEIGVSGRGCV